MTSKIFGYIRVSSKEQNLDRQLDSLKKYVPDERDIFYDKQTGSNFDRPGYQSLKYTLREGDTLYIHSLDRLGRNKAQVKAELEDFKQQGIIVRILDIPTSMINFSQFGALQKSIMEMVHNILIEVLTTMSETERVTIKRRQREGIEAAKKRGKRFGRPSIELPDSWAEDYATWKKGECTAVSLRRKYHLSQSTFYRKVEKWKTCGRNKA